LMLRSEEVHDGLDGGERREWDLDEDGDPFGHGAVPEPGAFQGEKLPALVTLARHHAGARIDEAREIERPAAGIEHAAHEIDRIEVGRFVDERLLRGAAGIDLAAFDDLPRQPAVAAAHPEGATAGLARVADD